jgi:hypothetical protein
MPNSYWSNGEQEYSSPKYSSAIKYGYTTILQPSSLALLDYLLDYKMR